MTPSVEGARQQRTEKAGPERQGRVPESPIAIRADPPELARAVGKCPPAIAGDIEAHVPRTDTVDDPSPAELPRELIRDPDPLSVMCGKALHPRIQFIDQGCRQQVRHDVLLAPRADAEHEVP